MEEKISVAIIDGSPRENSSSRRLALSVSGELSRRGASTRFFDQRMHRLPLFDDEEQTERHPAVQELFKCIEGADCIVLSSPEYHNSMSGALKNALDWLSRLPEGRARPLLLCGLIGGGGAMGNSGALVQMMMAVRSMKWWLVPEATMSVPEIWDAFNGETLRDPELQRRVERFSSSLVHYGEAFRHIHARG